ncbi:furin-like repeat protein (macronuclear) [Tetrahymena thermophila SB210]|uniref:Furin-like repeat protein n=1 Tax=Tetrahymena thermophila (strain SB210) TaxID=312017 RepID=Q24E21_TETTS|nr:furin-like repeat protein [Tetrahymena thermophila SB210]EAS06080.3 furin-like repeat protein [Tetrahymena thermophila SB210]|eukprot:XP_001026325.3 furin-like repeat protein [Tetrahymena thermophila SB210]
MILQIILLIAFVHQFRSATWNSYEGQGMQSIFRGVGSSSIKLTIPSSQFYDAAVVGYFKYNTFDPSLYYSMMRYQSSEFTFLHVYGRGSAPYFLAQNDMDQYMYDFQQGATMNVGQWVQLGFGYKHAIKSYYPFYQGYPQGGLVIAQYVLPDPLRSDITQIELCIFCTPLEYQYNAFNGQYASIKMIFGFTTDGTKMLINENKMSDSLLREAFYITINVINYTKTQYQPLTTDLAVNCVTTTRTYFDGICIDPSQCANVVVYQSTQYGVSNSVYYNQSTKQCTVCQDYCAQCDQNGNCQQCNTGYVLNASKCLQCSSNTYYNPLNSLCVATCPNGYNPDQINLICVQNFNPFYLLLNPLLSPMNFIQNNGFTLISSSQQAITDQFTSCWLENQSFGPYTILGGQNNLKTNYFSKQILGLPKNFQKIISFQGLIYNNGQQGDFNLFVNNNQITLSSFQKIFTNYQLCTDNQPVNYYLLTYIINDSSTDLNIKITSNMDGWGIRNFAMNITKCHSTCLDCTTDGNPWSCTNCQKQASSILVNNNCACQKGQYAQFQNCYSSPCYACANCPPNCQSCEDQTGKCTSCASGFSIQNGICISSSSCSSYYTNDPGSSYCLRSKDLFIQFFWQNRIWADVYYFWQYSSRPEQQHQCINQVFAPYLNGQQSATLNLQLINYQQYHYQVEIQLVATNYDNFSLTDYVSYFINSNLVKKANYHSTSTTNLCNDPTYGETLVNEVLVMPTQSKTFKFQILAYLVSSNAFIFNNVSLLYNRCHASCSACSNGLSCTSCITNSSLNASKGNFCYCNDGYYFTYDWTTSSGLCLPCNNFCQTCSGPSITDCLTCKESYKLSNNICVNVCQTNQFWDFSQHKCVNCSECCSSCTGPSSNQCSSCQAGLLTYNSPVCTFNSDGSTCNSCTSNVSNSLCGGSQTNNQFCLQNGYVSYNANTCVYCPTADAQGNCGGSSTYNSQCNYYGFYYSSTAGKCLSCSQAQGLQCGDSSISSICQQNKWIYQSLSTCISCVLQSSPLCCNPICMTCNGSGANNCLSCFGSQILFGSTCLDKCPNGYSLNQSNNTCQLCPIFVGVPQCNNCSSDCNTCAAATSTQCQTCYSSRQLNQTTKKCDCKDSEDTRNFFYECSLNNQAVLDIQLLNSGPIMTIDFGKILMDLQQFPSQTNSNGVCQTIFNSVEMLKIGQNALCQIKFNIITITLDMSATIMQGDILNFLPNVLQFKINSSSAINIFLNNVVYQQAPLNAGIVFNYNKIENSCNDFKITQFKILNDSGRGLKSITWSLQNPTSNPDDVKIQNILTQASQSIQSSIVIPRGIILLNSQKTISVSFLFKNSYSGSQQFIFQVQSYKNIVSDLSSNMNTPYYRFQDFTLQLSYQIQYCNQQGVQISSNDPVNIKITSPQTSQINISQQGQVSGQLSQQIQAYTFTSNQNNQINAVLTLSTDSAVTNTQQIQFFTQPADLIVKINGGNQKIDYKSLLKLTGTIRDLDVQDPNADQGITQVWSCSDPSNVNSPCVDQKNNPFVINQNNPQIPSDTFSPYTVIKIYLQGKKDSRQSSDSIIVLFIEFDLPALNVTLSLLDPFGKSVNLNEEIFAVLNYNTTVNPDILSFSSTIVYGDGVVGAIKFDYTQLRYRLWDYYSGFTSSNPTVAIRFSVFNPYFFMPSISIINLKINFPPTQCLFAVSPLPNQSNPAYSLSTLFTLSVSGCVDTNLPLTYQFFMYRSQQDLQNEINYPQQINRRQLNDQSPDSQISTILPAGNILLMAVVADSLQAVYNSTISLTVQSSNLNESQYISLIDKDLNTSGQTSQQIVSQLSLIAEDLSQRADFQTSVQINQRKILIINALNQATASLPTLSTFSTLSNKAVSSLFSSIKLTQQEQANQLSNIQSFVSQDWTQTPYQSLTDAQKQIKTQQIYDYFKIIDNMATSSPSQDTSITSLQLDISTKLGQKMNYNSLPNEDAKVFTGSQISIQSQQVTEKNLCYYLFCSNYMPSNTQKQQIIYNIAYKTYNQNPYTNDPSYQNFTNLLQQNIGNQTIAQYPVINPEINPSSSPSQNSPLNMFSNSFTFAAGVVKEGLSCLTKSNGIWSQNGCKLVYNSKSNQQTCLCDKTGPTTIVNDLQELINNKNLKTAFGEQGLKNISQFSNFYMYVAFWLLLLKTAAFIYLYIKGKQLDLDFVSSQLNGRITNQVNNKQILPIQVSEIKDTNQNNINTVQQQTLLEDSPLQKENNDKQLSARNIGQSSFQNLNTQIQIPQKPLKNNFIQDEINEEDDQEKKSKQSRKQFSLKDKQIQINNEKQQQKSVFINEEDNDFKNIQSEKMEKQPSIDDFNLLQTKQSGENFVKNQKSNSSNQADSNQQNQAEIVIPENQIETLTPENQTQINIPERDPKQGGNPSKDKKKIDLSNEQYSAKTKKFIELSYYKQLFFFHNFLSIFFIYDEKMPRKLRFSCFYVRIIHSFAISVIFNQSYDVVQLIALSIANALLISICLALLEIVAKYLGKYALAVTLLCLLGLYYYVILSIVSGESVDSSNLSIGSYFIFTCFDLIVISFLLAYIQRYLALKMIKKEKLENFTIKLFELLHLQIILTSII